MGYEDLLRGREAGDIFAFWLVWGECLVIMVARQMLWEVIGSVPGGVPGQVLR